MVARSVQYNFTLKDKDLITSILCDILRHQHDANEFGTQFNGWLIDWLIDRWKQAVARVGMVLLRLWMYYMYIDGVYDVPHTLKELSKKYTENNWKRLEF